MKVTVSGVVVETSVFYSDKRKRDIGVVTLYSDGYTVKIFDFPLESLDSFILYKNVDILCRIFEGKKGIGFSYAK